MKHKRIFNILDSEIKNDEKYHLIISELLGNPIYEIRLVGLMRKRGSRIKVISFDNMSKLNEYEVKLKQRKYGIFKFEIAVGYKSKHSRTYFRSSL